MGKINKKYKNLSTEDIEEAMKKLQISDEPWFKHHTWTEPDGTKCSSWQFKHIAKKKGERSVNLYTGDGGALQILEAFDEEIKKRLK